MVVKFPSLVVIIALLIFSCTKGITPQANKEDTNDNVLLKKPEKNFDFISLYQEEWEIKSINDSPVHIEHTIEGFEEKWSYSESDEHVNFSISLPKSFSIESTIINTKEGKKIMEFLPGIISKENYDLFQTLPQKGDIIGGEGWSSKVLDRNEQQFGQYKSILILEDNSLWYPNIYYIDLGDYYFTLSFYSYSDTPVDKAFVKKVIESITIKK